MRLQLLYLTFTLDDVTSLKGRRAFLNALKMRLGRMNLSLLDLSGDYPKEAQIAVAFLAPNAKEAAKRRESIETLIETHFPQYPCEMESEAF